MATKKKFDLDALFTPDNLNFEMVQVLDEEGKVEKEHVEHFVENDVKDVGMEM